MRLLVVLALVTLTSPAAAQLHDRAPTTEDPSPPRIDLGWRIGGGAGPNAGYLFTGIDAGYRLIPELALGGYGATTLTTLAYDRDRCGAERCPGFSRFGVRGELHLVPGFVIDPWASVGGGARVTKGSSSAEVMVGAGLDVRPVREVAVGAFVTLAPSRESTVSGGTTDVGLRLTLSLDAARPRTAATRTEAGARRF